MVDLIPLNPGVGDSSSPAVSTNLTAPVPAPIGELVLTATAPTVIPNNPWMNAATCHARQNPS